MEPGRTNKKDRLNFVKFWVDYIKTHYNEGWSESQNVLINSQFRSVRKIKKK